MRREGSQGLPEYLEGLVEEIMIDPTYIKQENLIDAEGDLSDGLWEIPANSILFRILNDKKEKSVEIAYPFFPSHFNLPIKVGEVVWIISVGSQYYWMCRQVGKNTIEDANITYSTRWGTQFFLDTGEESDQKQGKRNNVLPSIPTPNVDTFRDAEDDSGIPTFVNYLKERKTNLLAPEVVPRYTKRPSDFVIQGSNNTLICLGTDRGYSKKQNISTIMSSSAWGVPASNSGTIDIVTGRSRYLPNKPTEASYDPNQKPPDRTSPYTIINSLGNTEVDKAPFVNKVDVYKNLKEGDPDFAYDSSRLYISSKTQPDDLFDLLDHIPRIPNWKDGTLGEAVEVESVGSQASAIVKSDEIRIISRYLDPEDSIFTNNFPNSIDNAQKINGSIRIIKEGTRDDSGHSTLDGNGSSIIAMQPDGVVMIDGTSIVIGSGRENETNGEGDQIFLGADATEPIVLGTQLKELLTAFFDSLKSWLQNNFDTHIHPTGVGPSGPPTIVGADAGTGFAKEEIDKILSRIGKTK